MRLMLSRCRPLAKLTMTFTTTRPTWLRVFGIIPPGGNYTAIPDAIAWR